MDQMLAEALKRHAGSTDELQQLLVDEGILNPIEARKGVAGAGKPAQMHQQLAAASPLPRGAEIEACLSESAARVRQLHGLLGQWELPTMSPEQTMKLLQFVEELLQRFRESSAALTAWDDGVQRTLGPEPSQNLFWDRLDPAAAAPYSAHAFQREHLADIEKRCSQLRVRSVAPVLSIPTETLDYGIERAVGRSTELGFQLQILRVPRHGVPWAASCQLLAAMDATRQLALSRHFASFLGVERPTGTRYDEYHIELFEGPSLAELRSTRGSLSEVSLLFLHWRRELLEALLHLSAHCTFLLPHAIGLEHVKPVERGCRLVLTQLDWGAEFPEFSEPPAHAPPPLASAASAQVWHAPDMQRQRDELLLHDGVRMLLQLLGPPDAPSQLSAQLRALCGACASGAKPPTLRQVLSHPYFSPLEGFQRHDVQAAFERYGTAQSSVQG